MRSSLVGKCHKHGEESRLRERENKYYRDICDNYGVFDGSYRAHFLNVNSYDEMLPGTK